VQGHCFCDSFFSLFSCSSPLYFSDELWTEPVDLSMFGGSLPARGFVPFPGDRSQELQSLVPQVFSRSLFTMVLQGCPSATSLSRSFGLGSFSPLLKVPPLFKVVTPLTTPPFLLCGKLFQFTLRGLPMEEDWVFF